MAAKRLIARLREHDWLAAFIELAIVVVGILIALQVSNWNQERGDRARSERYQTRLRAELLVDESLMDEAMRFWRQVSDYGFAAMANSESGVLVDGSQWKTLLAYYQAGQLFPFEIEDTTFLEMRGSGDIALIPDETLRKQMADYYKMSGSGMRADILHHRPDYRPQIRGLTPWAVQQYIWTHCFQQRNGASQTLIDCPSPIPEVEAADIIAGYRRDHTLLSNLRIWMSTLRISQIIVPDMRQNAVELADRLSARAPAKGGRTP